MIGYWEHIPIPLPAAAGQYFTVLMIFSMLETARGSGETQTDY